MRLRQPRPRPSARRPVARPPPPPVAATGDPDARMTPAVRRLLREHGLSPDQIVGTGGGGRITRDDVLAVVEAIRTGNSPVPVMAPASAAATPPAPASAPGATPAAPPSPGTSIEFPEGADEVLLPMTQMRKGIAAQMTRALQVPHAYVHMEVDATNLVRVRERAKKDYQAREGISLSYVPFVIKAAVEALRASSRRSTPTGPSRGILAKRRIHMGVAVAVEDGLLVPVVRDVDQLSIAASTGPSPRSPRGREPASSSSTTTVAARSPSTTPAGSAPT